MEVNTDEHLDLLDMLDMVNYCEEVQECESDMEFEEHYDVEEPAMTDDNFLESEVETDPEDTCSDESFSDLEISDDDEYNFDILRSFINIIELDCILNLTSDDKQLKRRKRRWGVHPINQLRKELGHFENLVKEMLINDHEKFFNYTRMSPERFDYLLDLIASKITKSAPNAIPAKFRLLLTLRWVLRSHYIKIIN